MLTAVYESKILCVRKHIGRRANECTCKEAAPSGPHASFRLGGTISRNLN